LADGIALDELVKSVILTEVPPQKSVVADLVRYGSSILPVPAAVTAKCLKLTIVHKPPTCRMVV